MKWKPCLLLYLAIGGLAQGQFVIPEGTTSIPDYAYWHRTDLTNVIIPDTVTNIGMQAFYGCTNLTRITVGKNVTTIGDGALACTTAATAFYPIYDYPFSTLVSVCFTGDAPTNVHPHAFDAASYISNGNAYVPCNVTVYARPGSRGWINPTNLWPLLSLAGRPVWLAQIQSSRFWDGVFWIGVRGNANMTPQAVVLEACADLSNPAWRRLQTNTMSQAGTPTVLGDYFCSFGDTNTAPPSCFYRIQAENVQWP